MWPWPRVVSGGVCGRREEWAGKRRGDWGEGQGVTGGGAGRRERGKGVQGEECGGGGGTQGRDRFDAHMDGCLFFCNVARSKVDSGSWRGRRRTACLPACITIGVRSEERLNSVQEPLFSAMQASTNWVTSRMSNECIKTLPTCCFCSDHCYREVNDVTRRICDPQRSNI